MGVTRMCGVCEGLDLKPHGSREKQFTVHLDEREARGNRSQRNVTEGQTEAFLGFIPTSRHQGLEEDSPVSMHA
ncbi:hypothetical protein I79_011114 [Cricetulus griseus]|uniref:Uncharacterized protein n=1 Tax=Cricetulus griseus TaxID=10029 RepID=G3HK96_CRIGR|nr:hypothetical protein I79_011114 [Cricetulus griseus]